MANKCPIPAVKSLTATATELNVLDGVTGGTVTASKALVVDASKNLDGLNKLSFVNPTVGGTAIYVRDGSLKMHRLTATTDTYATEVKFNFQGTDASAFGIDCTCEIEPGGATPADRTAGGLRAVQGVSRIASGFTVTGGTDIGLYGQFCNLGTINGASTYPSAGYLLIEDGGTYTQVGVLSVLWLDSHLAQTVSAGSSYFLNITNNGTGTPTTFDAAIHVYAGNAITNLLSIGTATGMVSADNVGGSTLNFTNWKTVKIDIDGETHYLVAAKTIA